MDFQNRLQEHSDFKWQSDSTGIKIYSSSVIKG